MGKRLQKLKPSPVIVADPVIVPEPVAPAAAIVQPIVLTPGFSANISLIGVDAGHHAAAGAMLYGPRDFAAWGFNFDVAAPTGLATIGKVELKIASGDGEVATFEMLQKPFGWVGDTGLEIAQQGVQGFPQASDPADFIWVSQAGTLDAAGLDPNASGGYLNIGSLGLEYVFGADYRNGGEHYDISILLNGAVQASTFVDLI